MMSSPAPVRRKAKANTSQNIKVFLRCRPMNSMEKAGKSFNIVNTQSGREVVVKERPTDKFAKTFTFDHVFGPDSKQVDVYKAVAKNSVEEVLNGFNCTIFAYGQTGTGKTFTMEGERASCTTSWEEDPLAGIIPRCVNHLFDELRMQKVEFTMRVSFLELYNEELFDLLSAHDDLSKLRLYEDSSKKGSCIIQGLEEVLVRSKSDVYNILEKGSTKRQTAATLMNAHSSRSHTVFTVTVHMKENTVDGDELLKTGKLHLVDLAGSENIGRSGAVEKRAREAGNINMSLLTLGRVITALVEKAPHIPYRESKLTRLLQDALGGRTKTSVIATISPASINQEETLSTLDYAHRAKNIQNKPEVNQKLHKKELIGEYSQEIERLRLDLLAMREKSGVYLANENYMEMMSTIESQAQEITEKIGHIRTLQTEMEKKVELFSEVSEKLASTSQELSHTKEQLVDTRTTLSCTQRLLHTTAQEREEQRFLVNAHCKTEEKLQTDGHTLIDVASSTTSDLSRLHDKLDRKRSVEVRNNEVFEDFQESCAELQDTLKDKLMASLTQHTHTLNTATARHCGSVGECRGAVGETSSALAHMAHRNTELTTLGLNMVKKMTEVVLGGVQEAREEVRTASAQQKDMLLVLLDTNKQVLEELAMSISAGSLSIASLHSAVDEKLQLVEGECTALKKHQSSFTTQLEGEVQAYHTGLLQHTQQLLNNLNTLTQQHNTHSKDMDEDIGTLLTLLTALKEKRSHHDTLTHQHTTTMHHTLDKLNHQLDNTHLLTATAHHAQDTGNALLAGIRTHTHDTRTRVEDCVGELDRTMQCLGEKRCEMDTALAQHIGEVCVSVDACTASQDLHVRRLQEGVTDLLKGVHEQMEGGVRSIQEGLTSHSHTLQQESHALATSLGQLQGQVEQVQGGLQDIGLEVDSTYRAQKEMVLGLFTQDIVHDQPTGQTPVRRDYSYPHSLPVTSPHGRLLQRFRAHTASSAKLPKLPSFGDDLDDLGDTSTNTTPPSSTSTSMTESELTPDDLTTTTSRSRSGSVSSLKDQGFVVPRPRMQREDSGIPLSRSSSSSSITEGKENIRGTKQNSTTKKREIKPPSVFRSASLEKLSTTTTTSSTTTTTTTTSTSSEGRSRRILGAQN